MLSVNGLARRMQAGGVFLRESILGKSVTEQNTDECAELFRQKTHRTCERAIEKGEKHEQSKRIVATKL